MNIILYRPQNIYGLYNYMPLGLIQIGSVLKKAGHNVSIICGDANGDHWSEMASLLPESDWVGFSVTTGEVPFAISMAKRIKQTCLVPIIWGGWHPTLFPDQMENSSLCDAYVVGPGDIAILDAANSVTTGGKKKRFSKDPDLNELPVPEYTLFPEWQRYMQNSLTDIFSIGKAKEIHWLPYQSSMGCPHHCSFCVNVASGNQRYIAKNQNKVVEELVFLAEYYNVNHFKIIDDNFFVQKSRVEAFASLLVNHDPGFTWDAECRVDYFGERFINQGLLEKLKASGLVQLTLGVESASQRSLDNMKKGTTPEQAQTAIELCNKVGIYARCSFILDVPGDTSPDIYDTVRFIKEMRHYPVFTCGVHTFRPYPGSELTKGLVDKGMLTIPDKLEKWTEEKVKNFTATDFVRPWLKNHKLSSAVSFYQSLESGMWLKPHQFNHSIFRQVNQLFMKLAKFRNGIQFYHLPWERASYKWFKTYCYKNNLVR